MIVDDLGVWGYRISIQDSFCEDPVQIGRILAPKDLNRLVVTAYIPLVGFFAPALFALAFIHYSNRSTKIKGSAFFVPPTAGKFLPKT